MHGVENTVLIRQCQGVVREGYFGLGVGEGEMEENGGESTQVGCIRLHPTCSATSNPPQASNMLRP